MILKVGLAVIDRFYKRVENSVLDTVETATAYVIAELEAKGTATREDFDVAAIVAASHVISEGWDFRSIDRTVFWGLAAGNLKF